MNIESTRELFESTAFQQRFLMSVERVEQPASIVNLSLRSVGCPTKEEFVKRGEDGYYVDATLNAMWWSWSESIKLLTSTIPAEAKKAIDTLRQQYGKQPICCGNFEEGYGGDGMLQPPDPPRCCERPEENVGMLLDVISEMIIRTMLPVPGPLPDKDADATLLWVEIWRLRAAVQGPEGFDTWQDAATHERVRLTRTQNELSRLKAQLDKLIQPLGKDDL